MGAMISLAEAAQRVGIHRSNLLRAIKAGRISGTRDDNASSLASTATATPSSPPRCRLAFHKHIVYVAAVIRSFGDSETERLYVSGNSRRLPREILRRAIMRLGQLNAAIRLEDLRLPPSNRLEALRGNRAGQHSIRVNEQWRVCFRFNNGDAFDVQITDYH